MAGIWKYLYMKITNSKFCRHKSFLNYMYSTYLSCMYCMYTNYTNKDYVLCSFFSVSPLVLEILGQFAILCIHHMLVTGIWICIYGCVAVFRVPVCTVHVHVGFKVCVQTNDVCVNFCRQPHISVAPVHDLAFSICQVRSRVLWVNAVKCTSIINRKITSAILKV